MNKTIHINLGGFALIIDEDAYSKLDYYLTAIHNHFKNSEGYEEITNDIETRMGELFHENLGGRSIINAADVDFAIQTMGSLEDFGANPESEKSKSSTTQGNPFKSGKRIFRDPEDKILGGVCSGLSSYFGINDPIWLRIIFLLLFFAAGTGFLFYLIMWIIIPKAQSTADRLAMKGAPININSIAKEVEESINNLGHKINEFGHELGGQKKNKFTSNDSRPFSGITNILNELVDAIKYIVPKVFKAFFIIIGIICMIAIAAAGIGLITSGVVLHDYTDIFFGPELWAKHWFLVVSSFLLFLLPAIILIIIAIKAFFRVQTPKGLLRGIGIFWVICLFGALSAGLSFASSFRNPVEISKSKEFFSSSNPDTLIIDTNEAEGFSDFEFDEVTLGFLRKKNDKFYSNDIRIKVIKSEDQTISWKVDNLSNGSSRQEAESLAKSISYPIRQDGKRIIFPKYFEIEKGKLWRNQKIRVIVYVPEGKYCKITSRAEPYVTRMEKDPDEDDYYEYSGTVWKMGSEGFINTKMKKQEEKEDSEEAPKDTL